MTNLHGAAQATEDRLQAILEAVVVGAGVQDPRASPAVKASAPSSASPAPSRPPDDPEALCLLFEHSNSLRQNVDAYATNFDGFGHRLDPAIEFDADDADRLVGECVYLERLAPRSAETSRWTPSSSQRPKR